MRGFLSLGLALGLETLFPPLPMIAPNGAPRPGSGKRSRSRNRYTGAMLREIRAIGQARECARRLRQAASR